MVFKMANNFKNDKNFTTIDESVKYINPYNFISLPKNCLRKSIEERKGNLNGYIECTLKAKTPIIVPETQVSEEDEHKEYVFFNYGEKNEGQDYVIPVIPGSEIRGMLRSDYEVFTDSCMSTLSDDINFISRTIEPKKPGILKKDNNGNWCLYEAERYRLATDRKDKNNRYFVNAENQIEVNGKYQKTGDTVNFTPDKTSVSKVLKLENGDKKGILFIGESGGNKKYDSVFVNENEKVPITNLNEEVEKLKAIYDLYNDKAFNQKIRDNNKVWYAGYDIETSDGLLVWYSEPENGRTYLSLAAIGKEAYHRKLSELVKDFMPCVDKNKICNCCNLFGFVSNIDSESSKVRISDATYLGTDNPYDKKMTIKELASPHITNATFYALYGLNKEFEGISRDFDFNYDYKEVNGLKTLIDSKNITIRGRKQYWHHSVENAETEDKNKRNCTITPVKEGTEFKFKVYFNNIQKENLDELIAVLTLKYKSDYDLCHKIGKGKPLGFGSCKINVDEVYIRQLEMNDGKLKYNQKKYDECFDNEKLTEITLEKNRDMDTESMKEAVAIYDFDHIKKYYASENVKVEYPMAVEKDKENSMTWFELNKAQIKKEKYIISVLPRIIDEFDENGKLKENVLKQGKQRIGTTKGVELPKYKK